MNNENLLHNDSGPSLSYKDGFNIWSLDGLRVDEQLVLHPETQTLKQIHEEQNEEIKRIRIERFGWNRYLEETNAKVVDSGKNDIENTYEILARTPVGLRLITFCPSTGRRYALSIGDSSVSTCAGAQQWLWGNKKDLRIIGRT